MPMLAACTTTPMSSTCVAKSRKHLRKLTQYPTWRAKLGGEAGEKGFEGCEPLSSQQQHPSSNLQPPTSNLSSLISKFSAQGLLAQEMVALGGAHTIGQARCTSFRDHIYNNANIDASLAATRRSGCPRTRGSGDGSLAPLDLQTPTSFDNYYFKNLAAKKGLLHSDQQLFSGGSTDLLVKACDADSSKFTVDFAEAMIKMGDISPLTGSRGRFPRTLQES